MSNPSRKELAFAAQMAGEKWRYIRSFQTGTSPVWKHIFEQTAVFSNDDNFTSLRGYAKGTYWARVRRTIEHGPHHVPTNCTDLVLTASPIEIDGMAVQRTSCAA